MNEFYNDGNSEDLEFLAPPYTVLGREVLPSGVRVTTVVMDGKIEAFEIPVDIADQASAGASIESRAAREILNRIYDYDINE